MKENSEIRDITINEWVWVIFVILSLANIYGDELELSSLKANNKHNDKARKVFLVTASVAIIIYIYFEVHSYNVLQRTKKSHKNTKIQEINFLGNTLVLLGALLLIYTRYKSKDELTTEIP